MRIVHFGLVILLAFLGSACKDETPQPVRKELPAQPALEPLDDGFQETDSAAEAESASRPADPSYGLTPDGYYTLQIGLFQEKRSADRVVAQLNQVGIPAYVSFIVDPKPGMSGTYYRVRAGSFATTAAAREYGRLNLAPLGRDFWVDLKGRDSEPVHPVYTPRAAAPAASAPATQPKIVEPAAPAAPAPVEQPKIVEPPAPAPTPAPAPAPVQEQPAKVDSPSVQDW
jgi:hypothetical protein